MKGYIFNIKKFAIHDGPGIRTTVFLQGCPMSCWWCHNPESIRKYVKDRVSRDTSDQTPYACVSIDNAFIRTISVDELLFEIQKDIIFFEESGGGVTFSGGEPMIQHQFLKIVLEACSKIDIHTVVDTSGYTPYPIFASINEFVDLYLFDLKIIDDGEHKKFTGVSNKLIIDNMKKLIRDGKKLILRVPLIPGISDTKNNLAQLAKLIKPFIDSVSIDFLPYNKFAESKQSRFNSMPKLGKLETQSEDELNKIKIDFEENGFEVTLRG